ncbi:MAG: glutamyl-tRNA reductase [Pseudomonadales bacterium]|jgi:glutamyl-tRNA reductase|nr:glutamyl-tRNA reductase [Pseudomonadales bacterium]
MSVLALGFNHVTAPIELRERVAFPTHQLPEALRDLRKDLDVPEVAILSTCNRTEVYCWVPSGDHAPLLQWVGDYHRLDLRSLERSSYLFRGHEAVRHSMRVAAGLDSMVLGEPQILGQVKDAWEIARDAGTMGPELERLSQHTLVTAKRIRTDTDIGRHPVSVAYAAVSLAQQIFSDLAQARALLVGAGETIELVAEHLRQAGVDRMVIANRTLGRARDLATRFGADSVLLSDLPRVLPDADIVIASTAADLPVLGKGMVEDALRKRRRRPMFMVDIAVPRDIEAQVGTLDDVFLYTIDDLVGIIAENRRSREEAAGQAETMVDHGVEAYLRDLRAREAVETVRAYRTHAERIAAEELERHMRRLRKGENPEEVLGRLARALTNKLIHTPSSRLREAGADGRDEVVAHGRRLLGLDPTYHDE